MGWKLTWHCSYPLLKVKVPLMGGRTTSTSWREIPEHRTLQTYLSHLYALHAQIKPNNDSLFFIFLFDWRIIDLQYCVGFCHTSTQSAISKNTSLPSGPSLPSPTPSHPSRLSGSTGLSSLHHTNSHQWSVLLMVTYMFPCYSLHLSCLLLPPRGPEVHSLCLQFHLCPANRFISTVFIDFRYLC